MEIGTKMMKMNLKSRIVFAVGTGIIYTGILWLFDYFSGALNYSTNSLIFQGVFFGLFFGIGFPYFNEKFAAKFTNKIGRKIKPELEPDETIEIEGPATLSNGILGTGGKIFLTNKKLIFKSHKVNIQNGQTNIDYQNIKQLTKRKTGQLIDNRIRLITKDDNTFDFIVNERAVWLEKINERLQ